jgi:hypothetical protein
MTANLGIMDKSDIVFIDHSFYVVVINLLLTVRGLVFGRESPQELSRLNVSPPDDKPVLR